MTTIAIIDDRRVPRTTLKRLLKGKATTSVDVIDSPPLPNLSDYHAWILDNKICAIITDERLYEQAADSETHVTYNGHELAQLLRQRMPDFPIFVITAFIDDEGLVAQSGTVEAIIERDDFNRNTSTHVERIIRASIRFRNRFADDLAQLSELSSKLATGIATEQDKRRIKQIQLAVGINIGAEQIIDRTEWLLQVERNIDELQKTQNELKKLLIKKP